MINIICPPLTATGGTEALHQLCAELIKQGRKAQIVYSYECEKPCPVTFESYNCPYSFTADDIEENAFVVPEIFCDAVKSVKNAKKYIWWLSVINARFSEDTLKDESIIHLYQSEFARQFLINKGIAKNKMYAVSDYINPIFLENVGNPYTRDNVVLFNSAKGIEAIQYMISKADSRIKFQAVKGLQPREIRDLMLQSKVYVDFGHCPGKDRMPREALASGLCVITSRIGGFDNNVDIPIPNKYKTNNLTDALNMVYDLMENYYEKRLEFFEAKEKIFAEQENFALEVSKAFP